MSRNARRQPPIPRVRLHRLDFWRDLFKKEGRLLLSGLVISASLFAFFSIANEVVQGETGAFDASVLTALRDPANPADPIGPHWVEQTAVDFTALGGFPILVLMTSLAVVFLLMIRRPGTAGLVALSIAGGTLANSLLKDSFGRPRPDLVPHGVEVMTASFPSAHAMMTAITYLTLAALIMRVLPERRLKIFVLSVATGIVVAVGVSRVYLGVHWPTDVLAGWSMGFAWATAWWFVAALLQRRGRLAPTPPPSKDPAD